MDKSQAVRDAERAEADLARALQSGAPSSAISELVAVKARADERVAVLRRRAELPPQTHRGNRGPRAAADLLAAREQRRAAVRTEINDALRPVTPADDGLFDEWQRAVTALRVAGVRGAMPADMVRLTADVVRARNALTMDQGDTAAG